MAFVSFIFLRKFASVSFARFSQRVRPILFDYAAQALQNPAQVTAVTEVGSSPVNFFKTTGTEQSGRTAGTFGTDFVSGDCLRWPDPGALVRLTQILSKYRFFPSDSFFGHLSQI